ncbi:MAG: FHA domain-containing protein [Acidobacteriota bacterium]
MDPGWQDCPYCANTDTAAPDGASPIPETSPTPEWPSVDRAAQPKTVVYPLAEKWSQPQGSTRILSPRAAQAPATTFGRNKEPRQPITEPRRRIVGVLVTYSWKPEGQLFAVREGRNYLGSDPACEISLDLDGKISSRHASIIYRTKDFWIDDEKSMNGTYVNSVSVEEKQRLPDIARVKTGATVWQFVRVNWPK